MAFCHECGKPVVPPSAKFCRHCGASQLEEAPSPAIHVTLPSLVSPQVSDEPGVQAHCSSCSSPLDPGEKYCGICGSPAGKHSPATLPEPDLPAPAPASVCVSCGSPLADKGKFCGICGASANSSTTTPPLPPPLDYPSGVAQEPMQNSVVRLCRSCGNLIKPGDKFCSKCLAKVADDPAALHVQDSPRNVNVRSQTVPVSQMVCSSCGSPIDGKEKFCGICGTPVPSRSSADFSLAQPIGNTCTSCGAPVSATTKFCGACGAALGSGKKFF